MTSSDRYVLTWQQGLCRHGCGQPLRRPRNRFVNGHDAKLLDLLLDAYSEGATIEIRPADSDGEEAFFRPEQYAEFAFFPKGNRWFRIKAGIDAPGPEEIAGAEDPVTEHLDLGVAPAGVPSTDPPEEGLFGVVERVPAREWRFSLEEDLQTVRELVGRAADERGVDREVFSRLEDELRGTRRQVAELTAHADLLEAELARAVEEQTVVVSQDGLASLSDEQARSVLQSRVASALNVLSRARYAGDAREVADLLRLFRSTDPVRVSAMRALLGQEMS